MLSNGDREKERKLCGYRRKELGQLSGWVGTIFIEPTKAHRFCVAAEASTPRV